jgi:hypothetical protein
VRVCRTSVLRRGGVAVRISSGLRGSTTWGFPTASAWTAIRRCGRGAARHRRAPTARTGFPVR